MIAPGTGSVLSYVVLHFERRREVPFLRALLSHAVVHVGIIGIKVASPST